MMKFMKTIAYVIPVIAIFAIAIFAMPTQANAWDWGDGWYDSSNDGWYNDTCWDCGSNYGVSDGWYNDTCWDCYSDSGWDYGDSWGSDYCYDCYGDNYYTPSYSSPTYNNNWAYSTSWAQNTTEVINNNRNVNTIDIDLSGLRQQFAQVSNISASCYPNLSVADRNETVIWNVYAYGGNGNYTYSWSGTDGLSGSGSSISKSYNNSGTKTASVLVMSGNRSISVNCGTVIVEDNNNHNNNDDDFDVTCKASPSHVDEGERVRWIADVDGVDEDDVDFRWSGDADGDDQEVTERYNHSGTYRATVRARYNGQTETDTCTVRVDDDNDNGNVTLYSNPAPTGNLASLNSVYLSQVPYTGVEDNWKLAGIATLLALLSAWIAYEIVARKVKSDRKNAIANFKAENLANKI